MAIAFLSALNKSLESMLAKSAQREIDKKDERVAAGVVSRFSRGNIRLQSSKFLTQERLEKELAELKK